MAITAVCFCGTITSSLPCSVIVMLYLPLALTMGWFSSIQRVLLVNGAQIAVCFVIWLSVQLWDKMRANKLNELNPQFST